MADDPVLFICPAEVLLPEAQGMSFEEVRIADYLKAFTTTGRAPQPVPAMPTEPMARAALNLPPVFEPARAPTAALVDTDNHNGVQLWEATKIADESFQSINAKPKWRQFSLEELRVQAYAKGITTLPPEYANHPSVANAALRVSTQLKPNLLGISTGPSMADSSAGFGTGQPGEIMQSFVNLPDKNGHCFEEHRVAYLFAHRELTSSEITTMQAANPLVAQLAPAVAPVPAAAPTAGLFGTPAPAPAFGTPAPAFGTPASTFGTPAPAFAAPPAASVFGAPTTAQAASPFALSRPPFFKPF